MYMISIATAILFLVACTTSALGADEGLKPARTLLLPINAAESVLDSFFDPGLLDKSAWTLTPMNGAHIESPEYNMYTWRRFWKGATPGTEVFRLTRTCGVEIGDFDVLRVFALIMPDVSLSISATIDGASRTLLSNHVGEGSWTEYDLTISGNELRGIEIVAKGLKPDGAVDLMSITLVDSLVEKRMYSRWKTYNADWPHLFRPESEQPADAAPALGLLFDREGLESIRRKVRPGQPYARLFARLREKARDIKEMVPEDHIRFYAPETNGFWSKADAMGYNLSTRAVLCSFVGLVDNDRDMMRLGARYAFSLMHCESYSDSWHARLTGGVMEGRSFYDSSAALALVLAWDFGGSLYNDYAFQLARRTLITRMLPHIEYDCAVYDYIWSCNGPWFNAARILSYLACGKMNPMALDHLPSAEKRHDASIELFVLDDGGSFEGPRYFSAALGYGLMAKWALARYHGMAFAETLSPSLRKGGDYLMANLSSVGETGSVMPIGDSDGGVIDSDIVALLSHSGDPRLASLLAALLQNPGDVSLGDYALASMGILTIIAGPENLPATGLELPDFQVLPDTGLLSSFRKTPAGPVRFVLLGANRELGHSHADKSGIILEAFGEALLIDRGIIRYDDPRVPWVKSSECHNVLTTVEADGEFGCQVNPCLSDMIPKGTGDALSLSAEIDVTAPWESAASVWKRQVVSPSPTEFILTDTAQLKQRGKVAFHLQSGYPFTHEGKGWVLRSGNAVLRITPEWKVSDWKMRRDDMFQGREPVYHLALISEEDEKTHPYDQTATLATVVSDISAEAEAYKARMQPSLGRVTPG